MDDNSVLAVIYISLSLVVLVIVLRPRGNRKRKGAEPDPICGCEHHLAFHTHDGVCKGQTQRYMGQNDHGYSQYEIIDCTCQQYVGPVPAISPQLMRELNASMPNIEPYTQDK